MSSPNARLIPTRKENQMIVTLGTGHQIPLHWNDRFYEGDCPVCNVEIWERSTLDWVNALMEHWESEAH
jgi:hypothetical protein